ncbi:hypothetical protein [Larkinella terrae]|uniref:Uncharacterized protein n=1 Tax=Larkinella terrae TaxID=2025311 RepID=A0A7K0EIU9_9BACT|nr:hypothetical protein [Larkinella terrae]MRS61737.1 hypothetical protein [Larkinella terrae]
MKKQIKPQDLIIGAYLYDDCGGISQVVGIGDSFVVIDQFESMRNRTPITVGYDKVEPIVFDQQWANMFELKVSFDDQPYNIGDVWYEAKKYYKLPGFGKNKVEAVAYDIYERTKGFKIGKPYIYNYDAAPDIHMKRGEYRIHGVHHLQRFVYFHTGKLLTLYPSKIPKRQKSNFDEAD